MELLKVSENKRFLMKEDGSAFFWSGDTAWNLFHKLSREETEYYFKTEWDMALMLYRQLFLVSLTG